MPGHHRPQTLGLSPIETHEGGTVRICVGADHVCLHASSAGSAPDLGFLICVWPASEHSVYLRTTGDHEGDSPDQSEVSGISVVG